MTTEQTVPDTAQQAIENPTWASACWEISQHGDLTLYDERFLAAKCHVFERGSCYATIPYDVARHTVTRLLAAGARVEARDGALWFYAPEK